MIRDSRSIDIIDKGINYNSMNDSNKLSKIDFEQVLYSLVQI